MSSGDGQEYVVERIVRHDPERGFLVKWAGYSNRHNTWEPLEGVKELAAFDAYLDREQWKARCRDQLRSPECVPHLSVPDAPHNRVLC